MIDPHIVYEDNYLFVVDKPAGVVVNKADTTKDVVTLQDWIEQVRPVENKNPESDFYKRAGIVHRLDKDTSGVLIIAKDEDTFLELQKEFKERTVQKTYRALVHGKLFPSEGEVNVPVGRLPWDRKKFGVVADGKESRTLYKVLETYSLAGKQKRFYTLVEAYPQTGRTHQIRVHFRYLGFPIAGDLLYAGRKNIQHDKKFLDRHFLHAAKLEFPHPVNGNLVQVDTSLPEELKNFLDQLDPMSS